MNAYEQAAPGDVRLQVWKSDAGMGSTPTSMQTGRLVPQSHRDWFGSGPLDIRVRSLLRSFHERLGRISGKRWLCMMIPGDRGCFATDRSTLGVTWNRGLRQVQVLNSQVFSSSGCNKQLAIWSELTSVPPVLHSLT